MTLVVEPGCWACRPESRTTAPVEPAGVLGPAAAAVADRLHDGGGNLSTMGTYRGA